ncbi:MAG: hypothetical protein Q9M91_00055 [Candidatus Dojkabacteria bacterium]|nr:hypothetical protein [Candidatus Dojkabacteria bacterium]MDQ7020224.1 hypothetical protein [Candidatus Dojkabacteria bacterium]
MKRIDVQILLYDSLEAINALMKSLVLLDSSEYKLVIHFVKHDDLPKDSYLDLLEVYKKDIKFSFDENTNIGFGNGHNWLFEKYKDKYEELIWILNPDTIVFHNALINLEDYISKIPNNWGILEFKQIPEENPKDYDPETLITNRCASTSMIVKKEAFEKVGGYDSNFFMYVEDMDLSWRIRIEGYKLYLLPRCKVVHEIGSSSRKEDEEIFENEFMITHILAGEYYLLQKFNMDSKEKLEEIQNHKWKDKIMEVYRKIVRQGINRIDVPEFIKENNYSKARW